METLDLIISPISLSLVNWTGCMSSQSIHYMSREEKNIHRTDGTFVSIALYDSLPKTGHGEWLFFL